MHYVSLVCRPVGQNTRLSGYCQALYPRLVGGRQEPLSHPNDNNIKEKVFFQVCCGHLASGNPLWGYCTLLPMASLTGALYVSSNIVSAQGLVGWREWPVLLREGGTLDAGRRMWARGQESGRGPDTWLRVPILCLTSSVQGV